MISASTDYRFCIAFGDMLFGLLTDEQRAMTYDQWRMKQTSQCRILRRSSPDYGQYQHLHISFRKQKHLRTELFPFVLFVKLLVCVAVMDDKIFRFAAYRRHCFVNLIALRRDGLSSTFLESFLGAGTRDL